MAYQHYWRSTAGFLQDLFPQPLRLDIVHSDRAEPDAGSATDLTIWNPHWYDQSALVTVEDFSEMQGVQVGSIIDLWDYLDNTTVSNRKLFMQFEIEESTLAPIGGKVCLDVTAWADGDHMRWRLARSIYDWQGNRTAYTELSVEKFIPIGNNVKYVAGPFVRSGYLYYGIGYYSLGLGGAEAEGNIFYITRANFGTLFGGEPGGEEVDPDLGPESEPGGYGPGDNYPGPTFDGTSDPWVDYPKMPGIAALGLVNLYKCDVGSLVNLGAELFPDIHFPTSLSDVGAVIAAVSDSIWNSKLIDYIVSAHIVPVDVDVTGVNLEDIKVGTRTMTGILARKISDDIVEFDCGSIHIDEYYTNFIDYRGTRARIYIPFHGMVELKPEHWQSATLSLKYLFNVIDGSFVAQLYSEIDRHQPSCKLMIGQYTGCACVHIPMTGAEYASMFSGMIANAGGMVAGLSTGNPMVAATSAIGFAQSSGGGGSQMSNAYNASAGFYGYPCPYLIIERQISHFSSRYPKEKGIPLLVAKTIGSCSGFTVAEDIILDGIPCTQAEKDKIRSFFRSGVIIK